MEEKIVIGAIFFLLGLVQAIAFFVISEMKKDLRSAHKRITDQSDSNHKTFALREDVADMRDRIDERFDRIENKIDKLMLRTNE